MRYYPNKKDKLDRDELKKLNAEPWMIELLKLNPGYVCWGPHEDYMMDSKRESWSDPITKTSWKDFGPWELDELNECVNFYFSVTREHIQCMACEGSGYNPETEKISEAFYDFDRTGNKWCDKITQDELDALIKAGRFNRQKDITVEQVNAAQAHGGIITSHDAINRWILVETRAKRLGVWGKCPMCSGDGITYTAPAATVTLTLWWLHPRKGCSRGFEINNITREDLPKVYSFLREAAKRNTNRFSKIPKR